MSSQPRQVKEKLKGPFRIEHTAPEIEIARQIKHDRGINQTLEYV